MGRGADLGKAAKLCGCGAICMGTPDEKLVDAAQAAVGIAADKVDVQPFKVDRGIGAAGEFDRSKVLDVAGRMASIRSAKASRMVSQSRPSI